MIPSTPRSRSRSISAGSSIGPHVHRPGRAVGAVRTKRASTRVTPLALDRHLHAATVGGAAGRSRSWPARSRATAPGPERRAQLRDRASRGAGRGGGRRTRRCTPGRPRPCGSSSAASGSTTASCLGSMLIPDVGPACRAGPRAAGSARRRRPGPDAPRVHGSSAMAPTRSVTRSRWSSWKARTTPSAVTWASVST